MLKQSDSRSNSYRGGSSNSEMNNNASTSSISPVGGSLMGSLMGSLRGSLSNSDMNNNASTSSTSPVGGYEFKKVELHIKLPNGKVERLYIVKKLGMGSYGSVYEGNSSTYGRVAVKKITPDLKSSYNMKKLQNELKALENIKKECNSLLCYHYHTWDNISKDLYIVTELINGKSLDSFIFDYNTDNFSIKELTTYACKLLLSVDTIHKKNIIHTDIKPDNIMVSNSTSAQPFLKLIDFGLSCIGECEGWSGSRLYMPPEFFFGNFTSNITQDLWSLGIVIFFLCIRLRGIIEARSQLDNYELLIEKINNRKIEDRFAMSNFISDELVEMEMRYTPIGEVIIGFTNTDPKKRMSISKAITTLSCTDK